MKVFYLFLLFFLLHCSNDAQFQSIGEKKSYDQPTIELDSVDEDGNNELCDGREICSITETFSLKGEETDLDLLFVLDVSQSMKKDLKKLGNSMQSLLSQIKNFNWQMAFTTADHGDHVKRGNKVGQQRWESYKGQQPHFGRLMNLEFRGKRMNQNILRKTDNLYDTIFYDTLNFNDGSHSCRLAPYCQGDHEQPLRALKATMERKENRSFFRDESYLIAIIVTNEDERVEDPGNATTAKEVQKTFQSIFSNKKGFYGFGIIVTDEQCYKKTKKSAHAVEYGQRVGELARITHGRNISICSEDYGKALRGVSQLIRRRVLDRVHLVTAQPDPDSVKINIHPEQNVGWTVYGQEIVFDSPLEIGTQIEVTYFPADSSF